MNLIRLLICFFVFTNFGIAQVKQTKKSKIDSLIIIYNGEKDLKKIAKSIHDSSVNYYKIKDYNKAIFFAKLEVGFGKKVLDNDIYKKAIYNLGRFYYLNQEHYRAIEHYNIVIDSFTKDKKTYQAYCEIGRNYKKIGDYHQAITYLKKGLSKPNVIGERTYITQVLNLAQTYHELENYYGNNSEKVILSKIDSISEINGLTKRNKLRLDFAFANYYSNIEDYQKSKRYFLSIIKNNSLDNLSLIKSYNNLGIAYNRRNSDSAFYYLNKGLSLFTTTNSTKALLHSNLADYYSIKNQYENALQELQKSLKIIVPQGITNNYYDVPKIEALTLSNNKYLVLDNLKDKAANFLKLEKESKENIVIALQCLRLADGLLDIIKAESFETKSKLFWQKEASELYMLAVEAAYKLNMPEAAFYFMEKNKAVLLLENIDENELRKEANIPIAILEKEYLYKKEISNLENLINVSKHDFDSLQTKYYSLKIDYKNFVESLRLKYPEYHNYKTPVKITSLKSLQKTIQENQIVIEYILDDNGGYILYFTNNKTYFNKLPKEASLQTEIRDYINLISKPFNNKADLNRYNEDAERLKKLLLPSIRVKELQNKNKLLIIPDYTLQNLPFGSLKSEGKYLIEDYEISYAYSLSFLNKNKSVKREAKKSFIAFAPKTFIYDNLQILPRSETEVGRINKILNGEVLLDTSASKMNFFSKIKDYKVIHLSTHANANDSIAPWIAFKNRKLYLNELYTTKNQAELVVLNACNSSLGEINVGEGVFSLARGFFYSGANSVVSSLWNVNDKSNGEITTSFYRYLKNGKTKSAALRQAKLDYLNTYSLSESSPFYWSSLILIGDTSSISLNNYFPYLLLVLLIPFLLYFLKKRK